jgi:hypothetical protein
VQLAKAKIIPALTTPAVIDRVFTLGSFSSSRGQLIAEIQPTAAGGVER